jgi:hypothetical protein
MKATPVNRQLLLQRLKGTELTYDVMCRYSYKYLMKYSRKYKHRYACGARTPTSPNKWRKNMSFHKLIDGFIPSPPIYSDTRAVPPIRIEFSISESHNFSQCIQERLKQGKEAS